MDESFEKNRKLKPVLESEHHVSFLGVTLDKAKNRGSAPNPELYKNYIEDKFRWELQRDIATSWLLGDPYLMIGGSSIGKTTTINKMCSQLGYEVYYFNCTGNTEEMDLLGKYVSNTNRQNMEDPEFIFQPGPIVRALQQEEGKIKVLFLDEINVPQGKVLSLLHDVTDALKRNAPYTVNSNGGEAIPTNHNATKVIGAANPVSGEMTHTSPLSMATIRRFAMQRVPDSLPKEALRNNILNKIGHGGGQEGLVGESNYLVSNKKMLSQETLAYVPGITAIGQKYLEFHEYAKNLLASGQIGEQDRSQPFRFDDNDDVDRVIRFWRRFYTGDINKVVQDSIKYYYLSRLTNPQDRAKLLEKAQEIRFDMPADQRRAAEASIDVEGIASVEEADSMLGKSFLGQRSVEKMLKKRFKSEDVPLLNLTRAEVMKIRETGGTLMLVEQYSSADVSITPELLGEEGILKFKNTQFLQKDEFFKSETLPGTDPKWVVVWDVPESANQNFEDQKRTANTLLKKNIKILAESNPDEARKNELLSQATVIDPNNYNSTESASQVLYRSALYTSKTGQELYPDKFIITDTINGIGKQVNIGKQTADGIVVNGVDKGTTNPDRYITAIWEVPSK